LGGLGDLGAKSFHATKNIISGEGGALFVNASQFVERAEIIWEKGTNRSQFFRGQVDKYTWVDLGSSFLPSEMNAACLWAQLEQADSITQARLKIWQTYHDAFADLEAQEKLRRPMIPETCQHNAHMYYLLLPNLERRTFVIDTLKERNISAVFHYIPLHSSPAGRKYGRAHGNLLLTQDLSDRLLRLPLWAGMTDHDIDRVVEGVHYALML
jgi:dTDP-4-amino-4,6-dideoxygalactose transaminase